MAEFAWNPRPAFVPVPAAGHPSRSAATGFAMEEQADFRLLQVLVRRGHWREASHVSECLWGGAPPERPMAVFAPLATLLWSGPGQFFALLCPSVPDAFAEHEKPFDGVASLSDQGSGRVFWRLSGRRLRAVLARVCSIDLDPRVFPAGHAASTAIDHTNVVMWRMREGSDHDPVFGLLVFASFARSLLGTLTDAAFDDG